MATVSKGVFAGGLPWTFIGIGAAIAAAVIALDVMLEKRQAKFRIPVMAFAVGVYLPFDLSTPILFGGIIALLVNRRLDKTGASPEKRALVERMGLLAAAGLITGEALMGIGLAVPIAAAHDSNAVALFVNHFDVGQRGLAARAPVDKPLRPIEQTVLPQPHKSLAHIITIGQKCRQFADSIEPGNFARLHEIAA